MSVSVDYFLIKYLLGKRNLQFWCNLNGIWRSGSSPKYWNTNLYFFACFYLFCVIQSHCICKIKLYFLVYNFVLAANFTVESRQCQCLSGDLDLKAKFPICSPRRAPRSAGGWARARQGPHILAALLTWVFLLKSWPGIASEMLIFILWPLNDLFIEELTSSPLLESDQPAGVLLSFLTVSASASPQCLSHMSRSSSSSLDPSSASCSEVFPTTMPDLPDTCGCPHICPLASPWCPPREPCTLSCPPWCPGSSRRGWPRPPTPSCPCPPAPACSSPPAPRSICQAPGHRTRLAHIAALSHKV